MVSMTHTPESDELAGLLAALPRLSGDAQKMAVDAVLTNLESTAPEVARIVGAVVGALEPAAERSVTSRLGHYTGERPLEPPAASLADCLILTIKEVEWRAALAAFDVPLDGNYSWVDELPVWLTTRDGRRYAIAHVGTDGNTESAILFGRLYQALHPSSAILIGMAGGVEKKVKQGDVVIADHIHAYDFRKLTVAGPRNRAKTYNVPDRLVRNAESMRVFERKWFTDVVAQLREVLEANTYDTEDAFTPEADWRPEIALGDILAGGSLVQDGSLPEWAADFNDKVKAAEMEGAGFAAACTEMQIPWMVVRGIADIGEHGRKDDWQFGSTFAAASWVRAALRLGMVDMPVTSR